MILSLDTAESVVQAAGILVENYALRGAGAIHLASAMALNKPASDGVTFCCFDGRLVAAARHENLQVMCRNQSSEYLPPKRTAAKEKGNCHFD